MYFVSALWVDRRIVDTLLPQGFLAPDLGELDRCTHAALVGAWNNDLFLITHQVQGLAKVLWYLYKGDFNIGTSFLYQATIDAVLSDWGKMTVWFFGLSPIWLIFSFQVAVEVPRLGERHR